MVKEINTRKFLGWKVIPGAPKCRHTEPHINTVVLRAGYYTRRGKKEIYVHPKTAKQVSPYQVDVCGGPMYMDESWKPSPEMDSWLTKWVCNWCKEVEYINRAVLPLEYGGRR